MKKGETMEEFRVRQQEREAKKTRRLSMKGKVQDLVRNDQTREIRVEQEEICQDLKDNYVMPEIKGMAQALDLKIQRKMVTFSNGKYDPSRRTKDKVRAQYDTYIEILAELEGKQPQDLSPLYGK